MILRMNNKQFTNTKCLKKIYPAHLDRLKTEFDQILDDSQYQYAIIFSGAIKHSKMDDNPYPFRANPYFCRWLPLIQHPNCYLVYQSGKKPILIYFQEKDFWHKSVEFPSSYWVKYFKVIIVSSIKEVSPHLPSNNKECFFITDDLVDEKYTNGINNINPINVINILNYSRTTKTKYEIECLRAASKRAVSGHLIAKNKFKNGASEFDIHLSYCKATNHSENELPYKNIIAINENASILHYQHYMKNKTNNPSSFLIDAGACVNGYAADITRTYAFKNNEFQSLIDAMDKVQQEIINLIKIDITFIELHLNAHEKIAKLIQQFGLANGSIESLISNKITNTFFPHGLGHFLGLQVHDVGGFLENSQGKKIQKSEQHPNLRLNRKIEKNKVFTIEPGLYAIDLLINKTKIDGTYKMLNIEKIAWLKPYGGIRIEDNIRVLDEGVENLTRNAFAERY